LLDYDAAGNLLAWGGYAYTWDTLGQMLDVSGTGITKRTYLYTADGERIEERIGLDPLNPTSITLSGRGLDNKVLRLLTKTGSSWTWTKDYVYRDGLHLASIEPPVASQVVKHFHLDHLGTIRRITGTGTPAAVLASHDYYPFGGEATTAGQDTERMKFTGHERDLQGTTAQTDDLDYMHARYYNPNVARFLSVDPGRDVDPTVPQSWNMYSYVRNNPTNLVDPDGRMAWRKVIDVFKYLIKQKEYIRVARVQETTKRKTVAEVKKALDTVEAKKGEVSRVVRTEDKATRNTVATALDPQGRMRGPESSGGMPEHVHPKTETGPYGDVHVESILGFGAIGAIVAPFSHSLAQDPSASTAEIAAAAAWDITSTLDPLGITDLINYAFDLEP